MPCTHTLTHTHTYTHTECSDDTIITWTDPEVGTDIALSFAEVVGCSHIWGQIQRVQEPRNGGRGGGDCVGQHGGSSPGRDGNRMVDEFESGIDGARGCMAWGRVRPSLH